MENLLRCSELNNIPSLLELGCHAGHVAWDAGIGLVGVGEGLLDMDGKAAC